MSKFYSGTSGLVVPIPQISYPAAFQSKSRLTYYASIFNSLEVNSSFYKIPMPATVSKWVESVPDNFKFTFKLSKEITHVAELRFKRKDVLNFIQTISYAGNKKGCLLLQLPPKLKIEKILQLKKLLSTIRIADKKNEWKLAVEFRNRTWYDEALYKLLDQYKACLVIHDLPASAPPLITSAADFMYVRFHGTNNRYGGSYSDAFLQQYADHIKDWIKKKKTVYFYFNNTMGDAYNNLQTLNKLL